MTTETNDVIKDLKVRIFDLSEALVAEQSHKKEYEQTLTNIVSIIGAEYDESGQIHLADIIEKLKSLVLEKDTEAGLDESAD